jgi:ketosteroid isomerase-like protein
MRASAGYRKTADGWKAVHEHFSAPFDMASGKALFELQP